MEDGEGKKEALFLPLFPLNGVAVDDVGSEWPNNAG